jgi:hypothetical protein
MNDWVITIRYEDDTVLVEGGHLFYNLGKGIKDLSLAGIKQGLGEMNGNPIKEIKITPGGDNA